MKLLLLGLFLLPVAQAEITNDSFNYEIDILKNGNFNITINEKYEGKSARDIMSKNYLNNTTQKKIDESVKSIELSKDLKNTLSKENGSISYSSIRKVSMHGITATIKNNCTLRVSNSITNTCTLTSAKAFFIGKIMESGSVITSCHDGQEGAFCKTTLKGLPSGIRLPKRTPERLSVSGAKKSVTTFYKAHYLAVNGDLRNHTRDRFYSNNISDLWNKMISHLVGQQELRYDIETKSTHNGQISVAK
jgi:hypothetical protein